MPKRPSLLLVAPYFFPRHYGGAAQIYHGLFSRLSAFDVTILAPRDGEDSTRIETFDRDATALHNYRVRRIDRFELHFKSHSRVSHVFEAAQFLMSTSREFKREVHAVSPDVLICGGTYAAGWLVNRLKPSFLHFNYVHGEELTQTLQYGPLARHLWRAQLQTLRSAELNIAVSEFTAHALTDVVAVSAERVHVFPNFIDTDFFRPPADREAARGKLGWDGRTVILSIARLIRRKGLDHALRALAAGASSLPADWLYVIGGDGPEAPRLRALADELGLAERVRFLGRVPREQLPDLYGAADLFLLPNREIDGDTEGFGVVFLEANACGTAVIGGIAGGTAGAIEDGQSGLRVDGASVPAITEAIITLSNNSAERNRMAESGRRRAVETFGIDYAARRFQDLLLERLKKKRP